MSALTQRQAWRGALPVDYAQYYTRQKDRRAGAKFGMK